MYDGEYHTPLGGGFRRTIARQPKRVPIMPIPNDIYLVYVFGKLALGEIFPTQTFFFWHRWHHSNCCGDIDHGKIDPGGVMHTVVNGNGLIEPPTTFYHSGP